MIWPLGPIVDALKVVSADRRFPSGAAIGTGNVDGWFDGIALRALSIAIGQIGRGEAGGDNRGPDVARYLAPAKPPGNWCAGFVGWCYQEAARQLELALPFKRSLGAKRLGKSVGAAGRIFQDAALARPGDLLVLHRGAKGSWMGHVGLIERVLLDDHGDTVHTVEGNSGPRVRRVIRFMPNERVAFLASLRRA